MNSNREEESFRYLGPKDGLIWRPYKESPRGGLRLWQRLALFVGSLLALGTVAVSPAGPAIVDFIKAQADSIIAKDNEVFRQTSQMYQTPEFRASIDRNLGK